MLWSQEKYRKAIDFAAKAHINQKFPGQEYNYLVHVCQVAMEVMHSSLIDTDYNYDLAIQSALLHDTIEDTDTSYEDLKNTFGKELADGVLALSKNLKLTKDKQMLDSLTRIKQEANEIAIVKLADRITNLNKPPHYWNKEKIEKYRDEAIVIYENLKYLDNYLVKRLKEKIELYTQNYL